MDIFSEAFRDGERIPSMYTCDGENIHPPLILSDIPSRATSLVLIVEDPDVPSHIREDTMWVHWVVFDIDPVSQSLRPGVGFGSGTEGVTTYGKPGYGGPCPPDREHRYFFRLYALDVKLGLDSHATRDDVERAMKGHVVESAELMGRYGRS